MDSKEIIDLTHTMENDMPVFPGSPTASFVTTATFEEDGYHEIRISCSTHTGTHIDCGFHLLKDGLNTLTTPITHFFGRGLLVDCRNIPAGGRIEKEFLQCLEPQIKKSSFLLLHTGWSRFWGTEKYLSGFPVLHPDAAAYLSSCKLKGVGSDTLSFDPADSEELPVHHILLSNGLILVENLVNLESLPQQDFIFSCFPLKIKDGDGSPVRAVGIVPGEGRI
jgi:arylformamidase